MNFLLVGNSVACIAQLVSAPYRNINGAILIDICGQCRQPSQLDNARNAVGQGDNIQN